MWNQRIFMTRDQMREYDRLAIEELGMPGMVLMENAGRGAAELARELLGERRRLAVVAGPGNNGGDGFVIARLLLDAGYQVNTYVAVPRDKYKGDALKNLELLEAMSPTIVSVADADEAADLAIQLLHDGFVVDALLGTGVTRDVEGHLGDLIDAINGSGAPVMAVDLPSGLDADTGRPWGKAVLAEATATFGHYKRGLVLHPGATLAGKVRVVSIGVPGFVSEEAGWDGRLIGEAEVRALVPERDAESHKGTFGHLLLLAGSRGKTGAAAMAGLTAMRVGTGLVTVATTLDAQPILEARCPFELMTEAIVESAESPLADDGIERMKQLLEGKKALAVGPGIGTAPGISALALALLEATDLPVVVDADGLNILAASQDEAKSLEADLVLTPHPGEMARLMNTGVPEIQQDRIGAARRAAADYGAVVALKGARTVIAAPDGQVFVCPTGNPGMGSGGTGDVLTGAIGGFLAQGLSPLDATLLGVYLHGLAGDLAASRIGEPGLIAGDLIDEIPAILGEWSESGDE
jgi:NAD(P)H-hydrate epimerase